MTNLHVLVGVDATGDGPAAGRETARALRPWLSREAVTRITIVSTSCPAATASYALATLNYLPAAQAVIETGLAVAAATGEEVRAALADSVSRIDVLLYLDSPATMITSVARELQVDLIAVGRPQTTRCSARRWRSVINRIIDSAPCPVLVVPPAIPLHRPSRGRMVERTFSTRSPAPVSLPVGALAVARLRKALSTTKMSLSKTTWENVRAVTARADGRRTGPRWGQ